MRSLSTRQDLLSVIPTTTCISRRRGTAALLGGTESPCKDASRASTAFTEAGCSALLRYWAVCRILPQKEIGQKILNLNVVFPTYALRRVPLLCRRSIAGGVPCLPPALAKRGLKSISKNTGAIFPIAGHSGISQCFLRLVPSSLSRSGCIYGHWPSEPDSGRGEYYPGAWGSNVPEAEERGAATAGHVTAGHVTSASVVSSGRWDVSRRWEVCRSCLPKPPQR